MSIATPPSSPPQNSPQDSSPASKPVPGLSYEPFNAPRSPWYRRINLRVIVFALVMILPIGWVFSVWLNEVRSKGVYDRGAYVEVNLKTMSTFDMDQNNAQLEDIPKQFRALEGKKVLLIGEMWQPNNAGDGSATYFQLVYSKTKCCFSGPPLAQHFVDSNVVPGKRVYYYDVPVKVFGTLHIRIRKDAGVIKSVYEVDVDQVEPIES